MIRPSLSAVSVPLRFMRKKRLSSLNLSNALKTETGFHVQHPILGLTFTNHSPDIFQLAVSS
jgi:hypothetical protein